MDSSAITPDAALMARRIFAMMKALLALSPLLLLLACGQGPSSNDTAIAAPDSTTVVQPTAIDLSDHGLPLLLTAPDEQLTSGERASVEWNEESGRWLVTAGDHFGLSIIEETGDIGRLKAGLERDPLRKNTPLRETPDQLLYKTEFPDDPALVFIHFYRVVKAGDRTFTVQDIDGKTFNQQDIERMLGAISPKQPA